MRRPFFISVFVVFISLFFLGPVSAFAAGEATLKDGIAQYNEENYEEAIEILAKVREREPASVIHHQKK
jgi:multisubunit Na+/H+ antiporter MnhG subunit